MKILLGSLSERKLSSATKVITSLGLEAEITGFAAASNVPPTPWDEQTRDGASNRARDCRSEDPAADFCIGLESGLVIRYGDAYEEAWASVIDVTGKEWRGYSSGLRLPQSVIDTMNKSGLGHNDVMRQLRIERGVPGNAKDTWGDYTGGLILRDVSLEEALRNALIQAIAPSHSLYFDSTEEGLE